MLRRLQAGEVDLGGKEAAVQRVVDPHLLAYNDTWDKIDALLADCLSAEFSQPVCAIRPGRSGSTTGSVWTTSTMRAILGGATSAITTSSTTI